MAYFDALFSRDFQNNFGVGLGGCSRHSGWSQANSQIRHVRGFFYWYTCRILAYNFGKLVGTFNRWRCSNE